jgi:hypothetical protein
MISILRKRDQPCRQGHSHASRAPKRQSTQKGMKARWPRPGHSFSLNASAVGALFPGRCDASRSSSYYTARVPAGPRNLRRARSCMEPVVQIIEVRLLWRCCCCMHPRRKRRALLPLEDTHRSPDPLVDFRDSDDGR